MRSFPPAAKLRQTCRVSGQAPTMCPGAATIPRMETFRQPFWLCCQQEILRECAATSNMRKLGWKIYRTNSQVLCPLPGRPSASRKPPTAALIFILIRPGPWYSGQPVLHGQAHFTCSITGCTPGTINFL